MSAPESVYKRGAPQVFGASNQPLGNGVGVAEWQRVACVCVCVCKRVGGRDNSLSGATGGTSGSRACMDDQNNGTFEWKRAIFVVVLRCHW